MPNKLPSNVDKQFNERVRAMRAWDAAQNQQARDSSVDKIKNMYPIFNRQELVDYANDYKTMVTAKQREIREYESRTEGARLKKEHGLKLGFRESLRLKRADRKIEKMNRELKQKNDHFKQLAVDGQQRGDANSREFYKSMGEIIDQNWQGYEQDTNWTDKGDPTHSILRELGHETPEMREHRENKEQDQFERYGMPETPETEEATKFDDPNLVMDMIGGDGTVRRMDPSEINVGGKSGPTALGKQPEQAPTAQNSKKPKEKQEIGG